MQDSGKGKNGEKRSAPGPFVGFSEARLRMFIFGQLRRPRQLALLYMIYRSFDGFELSNVGLTCNVLTLQKSLLTIFN